MSTLGQLNLVTAVKPQHMPEIVKRRYKLSDKLWEQIQLAKSTFLNEPFDLKKVKTVKNPDTGQSETISVPKRVRPWWFNSETGAICFSIRYGAKVIELAKGKPSIQVESDQDLISTLELVKQAIEAGELDSQIEQVSGALRSNFKKKGD
jgi:hypothetical protein